ncbi:hypothetical protein Q604_UNBC18358G0009 [human gut metagenome]|uniref:HTH cro/C1-type domain-containing protein n=1 Tax=human gut metagenome TaxID=408170 RepID=W1WSB6_9ZZZZ|nr:helix-turn-helix transcriptional regulator [Clostridium butyricum]
MIFPAIHLFAQRLKKARVTAGISQRQLAEATHLCRDTINDYETGYLDSISKESLTKLLTVLDKNILCDDYCIFILNQADNINKLLNTYTFKKLSELLEVHTTTIGHWLHNKFQISRKQYEKIFLLSH